jgi:hypothetical protein
MAKPLARKSSATAATLTRTPAAGMTHHQVDDSLCKSNDLLDAYWLATILNEITVDDKPSDQDDDLHERICIDFFSFQWIHHRRESVITMSIHFLTSPRIVGDLRSFRGDKIPKTLNSTGPKWLSSRSMRNPNVICVGIFVSLSQRYWRGHQSIYTIHSLKTIGRRSCSKNYRNDLWLALTLKMTPIPDNCSMYLNGWPRNSLRWRAPISMMLVFNLCGPLKLDMGVWLLMRVLLQPCNRASS